MNGREAWRRLKRFVGPQYLVEPPSIEGTFVQSRILIRLLDLRPQYPELVHPRSQGTRVEVQDHCGDRRSHLDLTRIALLQIINIL